MSTTIKRPEEYWEERAQQYAKEGQGFKAICSYGMPSFYNLYIHLCQQKALAPWLKVAPGEKVLDVGCGVGRWSVSLARKGAVVTGVDLSATMIEEARRRAAKEGLDRCRFQVADLATLNLEEKFSLIIGVTVLQHILDNERFQSALDNLSRHLLPGGRIVLMEVAPSIDEDRCDTSIFTARTEKDYRETFRRAGLDVISMTGVDPAPFKVLFLPYYQKLPRPLALLGLGIVTLLSLPVDYLLGRWLAKPSWHKVFVLQASKK